MSLSVQVPFKVRKHGGRKMLVAPDGTEAPARPRVDNALVKALARAFRWKRMLEEGDHATLSDLAEAEKINLPYLSRVLRLTLLAPDIVEAVLDGRQPERLTLAVVLDPFPVDWHEQRALFG